MFPGYVFLLFLLYYPVNSAADFSQCLDDVIICAQNSTNCTLDISSTSALSILRTSQGDTVTSPDAATGISYTGCTTYCRSSQEQFSWTTFSQEYAAWLLPYLALISQLPFGAQRRTDNLMSAFLTLGSPTLAGFSLYMTLLNARWVNDRLFAGIDYPNAAARKSVVHVLTSLQQVPLRVHPGRSSRFESLVVHPDNDHWWTTFAEELDYSHRWSIASATFIAWVVMAFLFTVTDSIYDVSDNLESNGQGTGSGMFWLLPIVVGWLVLSPKCDAKRVHNAYHKANRQVFVAASDHDVAPIPVTSNFGFTIGPGPDYPLSGIAASPDESRIPPIFNYARTFAWYQNVYLISLFYRTAWRKSNNRIAVDGTSIPGNARNAVPRESRLGSRDQIICYCQPADHERSAARVLWPRGLLFNMTVASLMSLQLQWGTTGAAFLAVWFTPTIGLGCRSLAYLIYGVISTAVWMLLVSSGALGYYAQHLADKPVLDPEMISQRSPIHTPLNTARDIPTTGLADKFSCVSVRKRRQRHLTSSLLKVQSPNRHTEGGHVTPTDTDPDSAPTTTKQTRTRETLGRMLSRIADWLRWTGKLLAIVNAIGIIANSIFQYAGVYTNCFCDSSVFTWGASAFNVIDPSTSDIDLTRSAWIGALALGLSSSSIFVGSIYLVRDALPF